MVFKSQTVCVGVCVCGGEQSGCQVHLETGCQPVWGASIKLAPYLSGNNSSDKKQRHNLLLNVSSLCFENGSSSIIGAKQNVLNNHWFSIFIVKLSPKHFNCEAILHLSPFSQQIQFLFCNLKSLTHVCLKGKRKSPNLKAHIPYVHKNNLLLLFTICSKQNVFSLQIVCVLVLNSPINIREIPPNFQQK